MSNPALIVSVRFRSRLSHDDAMKIAAERAPDFRALAGLQQKYYMQDAATGEYVGLYLWESAEHFTAYRDSELRASIADAYEVEGEPIVSVHRVVTVLRDES